VGAGLGPRQGDLDPHPGHGDRAVTLPGTPDRGRRRLDALDAALGELRAAGWPAPEDPDSGEDTELGGRDNIAGRRSDEVSWLRQCAGWLSHLDADSYPPAVNLRPSADWPDRAIVAAGLARVAAVIGRIAADVDELARARRAWECGQETDWHDHGGSSGSFAAAEGCLVEQYRAASGRRLSRRQVAAGRAVAFGPGHVHNVAHGGSGSATSIHAYSPPLLAMTY
jgi:hypothetical protein